MFFRVFSFQAPKNKRYFNIFYIARCVLFLLGNSKFERGKRRNINQNNIKENYSNLFLLFAVAELPPKRLNICWGVDFSRKW